MGKEETRGQMVLEFYGKKKNVDHSLTPYAKMNPNEINDQNTTKLLEGNIGINLHDPRFGLAF